jgi:hypothetical protein
MLRFLLFLLVVAFVVWVFQQQFSDIQRYRRMMSM